MRSSRRLSGRLVRSVGAGEPRAPWRTGDPGSADGSGLGTGNPGGGGAARGCRVGRERGEA